MSDRNPTIKGRCVSCEGRTLFVGDGGWITCSWIDCENPGAAGRLLERGIDYVAAEKALAPVPYVNKANVSRLAVDAALGIGDER